MGLFEPSQLQLRQLGRLRCLLGLRQPEQLPLVPEDALVVFDAATEVPELTETLRGRVTAAGARQTAASDGTVTPEMIVEQDETTTEGADSHEMEQNVSEVNVMRVMGELERSTDDWPLVPGGQVSKTLHMTRYSTGEVDKPADGSHSSSETREPELTKPSENRESNVNMALANLLSEARAGANISTATGTIAEESGTGAGKINDNVIVNSEMTTHVQRTSTEPSTTSDVQGGVTLADEIKNIQEQSVLPPSRHRFGNRDFYQHRLSHNNEYDV